VKRERGKGIVLRRMGTYARYVVERREALRLIVHSTVDIIQGARNINRTRFLGKG
jgi:hypothetical protein